MRGRVKRIAGIALAAALGTVLGGCSLVGGALDQLAGRAPADDSSVFSIKVGDCFTEPVAATDGTVSEIEIVACGSAHDDEAIASILLTDAEFPSLSAIEDKADDACLARFLDFTSAPANYDGSLNFSYFYPSQESWDEGDREILCYAFDMEGTTVGSLKDGAK